MVHKVILWFVFVFLCVGCVTPAIPENASSDPSETILKAAQQSQYTHRITINRVGDFYYYSDFPKRVKKYADYAPIRGKLLILLLNHEFQNLEIRHN